jgi:hypothetical protein
MKKYFVYLFLFITSTSLANAQIKKETSVKKNEAIKKPALKSFLGNIKDSLITSVDQAKKIIDNPLVVLDENKNSYNIISFGIIYKKLGYNIDPKSGKEYKVFTYSLTRYTDNPIPEKWRKLIREVIVSEEELIFTDIYVKDKQGKFYLAPSLKIILR